MDPASLTTAVATAALALLTAWYVRLTRQMLQQVEASRQPSVIVDLCMPDGPEVLFEVGNVGERPARDVRLNIDDRAPWSRRYFDELPLFSEGIAYLAPGRRLQYSGGFIDWERISETEAILGFTISYRNEAGQRFERKAMFDLQQYTGVRFSSFGHPVDAVAREIQRMRTDRQAELRDRLQALFHSSCPVCAQSISTSARKCPQCHEWLEEDWAREGTRAPDSEGDELPQEAGDPSQ